MGAPLRIARLILLDDFAMSAPHLFLTRVELLGDPHLCDIVLAGFDCSICFFTFARSSAIL